MSIPPLDLESLVLATHVTHVFGLVHRIAYAHLSPELTIVRASPNFSAVLNEQAQPILNQPLTRLLWEFVGVEESLRAIMAGALPFLAFERVNRVQADGRTSYFDLLVTPLSDKKLGDGLLLIVEDVTHTAVLEQRLTQNRNELDLTRKRLSQSNQELQRLNRLKSLFLSMAVHDLRSPLTAVQVNSDLLLHLLPAEQDRERHYATVIRRQSSVMDWLIDDFLDLDQIEQGALRLKLALTNLNLLVEDVTSVMSSTAALRRQKMTLSVPDAPLMLSLDRGRLQQVLYNLLNNAIKFTPDGGEIAVTVTAEPEWATLQVADSGIGMSAEQAARAFDLYYRVEDEQQHKSYSGKGLGLYIVKMLVEAHGGEVGLDSEAGAGSRISVRLPRQGAAGAAQIRPA